MDLATLAIKADTTDLKNVNSSLDELVKKGGKAENTTKRLEKFFDTLGKTVKNAVIGIAAAGTAVAAVFLAIGTKGLQMASDLEETQGKFDVVFRGLTEDAEKWSTTLVDAYAMTEEESKRFLSGIQDLVVPTGLAREEAGKLSNQFVQMAADLGSFNNLPTQKVIEDIQSALAGGSETLTKYGINVKVANVRQEALNMGLIEGKEILTAAQRVQVIYNIMLREGADAMGDMARTSDSYANQTKKFKANIDGLITSLGEQLLPVATELVSEFNDWWKINGQLVSQDIGSVFRTVADAIGSTVTHMRTLNASVQGDTVKHQIIELREELGKANEDLYRAQEGWFGFGKASKEGLEIAQAKVDGLMSKIIVLESVTDPLFTKMEDGVGEYKESITEVIEETEKLKKETVKDLGEIQREWERTSFVATKSGYETFQAVSTTTRDTLNITLEKVEAVDEALEDFFGDMDEGVKKNNTTWSESISGMSSVFRSFADDLVNKEFNSVGDAFDVLKDRMIATWISLAAEMAANSIFEAIFGGGSSGGSVFGSGSSSSDDDSGSGIFGTIINGIGSMFSDSETAETSGDDSSGIGSWFADLFSSKSSNDNGIEQNDSGGGLGGGLLAGGAIAGLIALLSDDDKTQAATDNVLMFSGAIDKTSLSAENATNVILEGNGALGENTEANSSNTASTTSNTEANTANTESQQMSAEATDDATEKTFDLTDKTVDLAASFVENTVQTGLMTAATAVVGPTLAATAVSAINATAAAIGLTGAWNATVSAAKEAINSLQDAIGDVADIGEITGEDIDDSLNDFFGELDENNPAFTGLTGTGGFDQGAGSGGLGGGGPAGDQSSSGDASGPGHGGTGGLGGFANGGFHSGGFRLVGEAGPEIEFTPPSRVFSNADSKKLLGDKAQKPPVVNVFIGNEQLDSRMVKVSQGVNYQQDKRGFTGKRTL